MNTKRIICLILATVMMSLSAVNVFATASVTASTVASAASGETVQVSVSISDASDIYSGTILLTYSTDQLSYDSAYLNSGYGQLSTSSASSGSLVITIVNAGGVDISGTLATITFQVVADAYTQCYINVTSNDCIDSSGNSVTVNSGTTVLVVEDEDGNTESTTTGDDDADVDLSDDEDEVVLDEDEDDEAVTEATTTAATTTEATTTTTQETTTQATTTTRATTTTQATTTTAATTTATQETTTAATTTTEVTTTEVTTSEETVSSDSAATLVSSDETAVMATVDDPDENSGKASGQTIAIVIVILVITIAGVATLEVFRNKSK
ncbi:MAG: cohesin domain-containing protein [Oscillospiraceae bacterium]|nr:cohesin domain-containing protein [Oscillospiraceae bacterium]